MNRRKFLLTGASAAAVGASADLSVASEEVPSLRALARSKGLHIGSCHSGFVREGLASLYIKHCSIMTPENHLKASNVSPWGSYFNFMTADRIHAFCKENGMAMHGHTLFWYQTHPAWLVSDDFGELTRNYSKYIEEVVPRYRDITLSWDVLNEIIPEGRGRYRAHPLLDAHGDKFPEFMLKKYKEVHPEGKSVVNDYLFECDNWFCADRRKKMIEFLGRMRRLGAQVDVVGIQSHLVRQWGTDGRATARFIRQLGDMGYEVHLSELDVNDVDMPRDIQRRDREVAAYYRDYLSHVLQHKNVSRVIFWGMSDQDNWIVRGQAPLKIAGVKSRPALFDADNQPKLAFWAVVEALRAAPMRPLLSVRDAQDILSRSGHDPGPVDGRWGQRTLGAVNEFRQARGLGNATEFDIETQELLLSVGR